MRKLFIWLMALATIAPAAAHAQGRPANAVAQDGSDSPPLANEFGPQPAVDDGLDTTPGSALRTAVGTIPPTDSAGNDHGKFRLVCPVTTTQAADPIVWPGQPHKSHIHTFFGNTLTDAFSNYTSLRTTGDSSCNNKLWRSAYWLPAVLDGPGDNAKVRQPRPIIIYYQGSKKTDPECTPGDPKFGGRCVPLPNGIKVIAGYDMLTGQTPSGTIQFKCVVFTDQNSGGYSGPFGPDAITQMTKCPTPPSSETGVKVILDLLSDMPQCWDGRNLDSPNHRSHVADYIRVAGVGQFCPKTHPYQIPNYTAQVQYEVDSTFDRSGNYTTGMQTWYLSSDRMPGMPIMRPFSTYHFDLFDAGNQTIKKTWQDNCIDRKLSCSDGGLGDGTMMVKDQSLFYGQKPPLTRPKMAQEVVTGTIHGPQ